MAFFRDPQSLIPIPGIGDGDFSFWARSKNSREVEIPGIGIFILGIGIFGFWGFLSPRFFRGMRYLIIDGPSKSNF